MNQKQIKQMVRACMNHLKKKEYELFINKNHVDNAVKVTNFSNNCWRSRAGENRISINIGGYKYSKGFHKAIEYDAYRKDPIIGERNVSCWQDHVFIVVAHEVSHHVQRTVCRSIPRYKETHRKSHGKCFQSVYRYLRRDFINPILDRNLEEAKELQRKTYFKMPVTIHAKSKVYERLQNIMRTSFWKGTFSGEVQKEFLSLTTLAKGTLITHDLKMAIAYALKEVNFYYYQMTHYKKHRYVNKQRYLFGRKIRKQ